jgi:hypothetical protein
MEVEMEKRIGIYARVSTLEQSAVNQLLDLRGYCKARGWQVVAECVDHGISGAKDDRPQLRHIPYQCSHFTFRAGDSTWSNFCVSGQYSTFDSARIAIILIVDSRRFRNLAN